MSLTEHDKPGCNQCAAGSALDFDFTMAFQPIVDLAHGKVFAQEALVRGLEGQGAGEILGRVNDVNRCGFDQACRVRAIQLAAELGVKSLLSINFLPNAVYRPESCIRLTIEAAEKASFPIDHIVFEFTEGEKLDDPAHVREIVDYYKRRGFKTAIEDFGAGYAGLGLLADFKTDLVKLDMGLIRNIESDWGRRTIVKGILQVCRDLGIVPIAEGVETRAELEVLQDFGVELFQGYYFAAPAFRSLATIPPERLPRP